MIVIVAGARHRQGRGLSALAGQEKSDGVDFTAVWRRGIGPASDIVELGIVVDERDTIANRDEESHVDPCPSVRCGR